MNQFEEDIFETFKTIRQRDGHYLLVLYPPTRMSGVRGKCPMYVRTDTSLFDVAGWTSDSCTFIGVELKETNRYSPSLPIIKSTSHGSGLQQHQLEALASVQRDGGHAGVVWRNGGMVGICSGPKIQERFLTYMESRLVEENGQTPKKGARSIPWSMFTTLKGDLDGWIKLII